MGLIDYFLDGKQEKENIDIDERVIAVDDDMSFGGNCFYHPMTPGQKIFFSDSNVFDINSIKDELLKNYKDFIKIMICKRLLPNNNGNKDLLLSVSNILKKESYDYFKDLLISLTQANLWSDILLVVDTLEKDDEAIDFVADLFANQISYDMKSKNQVIVVKLHLQKTKNLTESLT